MLVSISLAVLVGELTMFSHCKPVHKGSSCYIPTNKCGIKHSLHCFSLVSLQQSFSIYKVYNCTYNIGYLEGQVRLVI